MYMVIYLWEPRQQFSCSGKPKINFVHFHKLKLKHESMCLKIILSI
jgi:hypothetical protein